MVNIASLARRAILLSALERCKQLRIVNCGCEIDAVLLRNDATCFSHGAQVFDFCATHFSSRFNGRVVARLIFFKSNLGANFDVENVSRRSLFKRCNSLLDSATDFASLST
jgi:hypothetical protein